MNLKSLLKIFTDKNCKTVYTKRLSPNDNSKNQVYLGGSFDVLNILPFKEIIAVDPGDWKRNRFKTKLNFSWVTDEGQELYAPDAQLILYPKYPEVRFSGFLKSVKNGPSELMTSRIDGRLLFFGISISGEILGYVTEPDSEIANEFLSYKNLTETGVFKEITLQGGKVEFDTKEKLIAELKRIHNLGWIDAKRLDAQRNILPCVSTNCGGYTLEAELGITPNGYSEPDYLGWEIKQFSVKDFTKFNSAIVTLMTPEPTDGFYTEKGIEAFIRKYGYEDKMGREARINFGGIFKSGIRSNATGLMLFIDGYDFHEKKITNTGGCIGLLDENEHVAASWSFSSLIKHWNTKHAKACYIPSINRKDIDTHNLSKQQYSYGNNIILGRNTDFSLLLEEISRGNVYYDPGIKLELAIPDKRKQLIKRRSQFRTKSLHIPNLYKQNEIMNLNSI